MMKKILLLLASATVAVHSGPSDELISKAVTQARQGKLAEARETATAAITADAANWPAYLLRAQVASRNGDHQEAVDDLAKLIQHDPQKADFYMLRGMEYFRLGKMKESIADFDQQIKLVPLEAPQHWQRGIACYYAGRYEDGKKQFELHQTVNPSDVENAVWHFLCAAKVDGFESARRHLIAIPEDRRIPMMAAHDLFAGKATPEDVMAAALKGMPSEIEKKNRMFYAHLYVGLYWEAKGKAAKSLEHIRLAAGPYFQDHYMGDVARVHLKLRSEK
jgi:lipoprotein NlpI